MNETERAALRAWGRYDAAVTEGAVWSDFPFDVEGLHPEAEGPVRDGIRSAKDADTTSPHGVVLQGQKGIGKTHLLTWVRRLIQSEGGYFFLLKLARGREFWENVTDAIQRGIDQEHECGDSQLVVFLRKLAARAGVSERIAMVVTDDKPLQHREDLDELVAAVVRIDRRVGVKCQDCLRALVLYASSQPELNSIGVNYLLSVHGTDQQAERANWGIGAPPKAPQGTVEDVSWLLALTGPAVMAVDQIDALVEKSAQRTDPDADPGEVDRDSLFAGVGEGLMALREWTRRTLSIVSCLPHSWELLRSAATDTVQDRFRDAVTLGRIADPELGRRLVRKRLDYIYREIGYKPPHPLWPIRPSAFDTLPACSPRWLIRMIDQHITECLNNDEVRELERFADGASTGDPAPASAEAIDLGAFDAQFTRLRQDAPVENVLDPDSEDALVPKLLTAGLSAWVQERPDGAGWWVDKQPHKQRPALHALLVHTVDEELEDEQRWAFRAIGHPNARNVQTRLRKSRGDAELSPGSDDRFLVVLRNRPWPGGAVTHRELTDFRDAGGRDVPITGDDLRTFHALKTLLAADEPGLGKWLRARRPATRSELFSAVLPDDGPAAGSFGTHGEPQWPTEADNPDDVSEEPRAADSPAPGGGTPAESSGGAPIAESVPVGRSLLDGRALRIPLESLRKHVVVFAGSGSGKTVLLRRLVEECAMLGVSAIVLDQNNDLARLGDPWPAPPAEWQPGDADKAAQYRSDAEVLVWTPGHSARPLVFRVLPDFAGIGDDEDDFRRAVDIAVQSLAPHAKASGTAAKAKRSEAVLREAIIAYGRQGNRSLEGLISMLAELPSGVSRMGEAAKLAAEMAEMLRAAQVNDPMFKDGPEAIDPGELLTPSAGKRARVSVINFIGLQDRAQQQSFVGRLHMELFSWIKANPSNAPLGWLLVIDEAKTIVPATGSPASAESTILLASQARKFGLGLVFASQEPKSLHNHVSGNASTMAVGRISVSAQINAVHEMARAKQSTVPLIGKLKSGEFYVAPESSGFQHVRTPLCLSHHPSSPLTEDEVIRRARGGS